MYPLGFLRESNPLALKQVSLLLSNCDYSDIVFLNRGQLGA